MKDIMRNEMIIPAFIHYLTVGVIYVLGLPIP